MLSLSGDQPATVEVRLDGFHWTVKTSSELSGHVKENSLAPKVPSSVRLSLHLVYPCTE